MTTSPQRREPATGTANAQKFALLGFLLLAFLGGVYLFQQYFDFNELVAQEQALKEYYRSSPLFVLTIAFLIYVLVVGLSIPGATLMSLTYAWFFGFWVALTLISFASTAGATISFLSSRYVLRDWIQNRFGERLETINEAFDREGNFYLFMMRLIPVFPFVVVNLVMGLTRIRVTTFWWVSQLGMLAGTAVYVYAGSTIPDLKTVSEHGINAIFSPQQMLQFTVAFALIGLLPLVAKKIVARFQGESPEANPTQPDNSTR